MPNIVFNVFGLFPFFFCGFLAISTTYKVIITIEQLVPIGGEKETSPNILLTEESTLPNIAVVMCQMKALHPEGATVPRDVNLPKGAIVFKTEQVERQTFSHGSSGGPAHLQEMLEREAR